MINNKIICPLCRFENNFNIINISDLSINATIISLTDFNNKTKKPKPKIKRSKSVDCFFKPSKKQNNYNKIYVNRPYISNINNYKDINHNYKLLLLFSIKNK